MIKNDINYIKTIFKSLKKSLKNLFIYNKKCKIYTTKKILVVGGYGYGNVGDEAQCNATLKLLKQRYKNFQIINLTPNIEYSMFQHPEFIHDFASRVLFFNQNRIADGFDLDNSLIKKIIFLTKSCLILLNAYLARADLPLFGINSRIAKMLYELKECNLLYFCGGGFLTGRTLSRLWDGILLCRLCHIFQTPVVMSGQTIGIWGNKFNQLYAKYGFKYVDLITVRDNDFSLNDLKKIGLYGENYFQTHDDALHCEKSNDKQINENHYLTINFHYWGMNDSEKSLYIDKINKIITYLLNNTDYKLVFIPMHFTDKYSFDDYIQKYPNERFKCFEYDYDFRKIRRVIADSEMCITMKHHPIIFAMGEKIPTLSLTFSDYYLHKNVGALKQYGQEKFSIKLESNSYYNDAIELLSEIINNQEMIKENIDNNIKLLDKQKEKFLSKVDEILHKN